MLQGMTMNAAKCLEILDRAWVSGNYFKRTARGHLPDRLLCLEYRQRALKPGRVQMYIRHTFDPNATDGVVSSS